MSNKETLEKELKTQFSEEMHKEIQKRKPSFEEFKQMVEDYKKIRHGKRNS